MNNANNILATVNVYSTESEKFWNGNNAAGGRARKALMEIIKLAKEDRKNIQEEKNRRKATKA